MSPSSRGLGHRPFTAVTGVRSPRGYQGEVVAQFVRVDFQSIGRRFEYCRPIFFLTINFCGLLAQLGERLPYKQEVCWFDPGIAPPSLSILLESL